MNDLMRRAVTVLGIAVFILIAAGAVAEAQEGVIADLMAVVAVICGLAGWRMVVLARRQL